MLLFCDWPEGAPRHSLAFHSPWDVDRPLLHHIGVLPLEILMASFESLPLKDLVTATHVCKYWRSMALSYAKLWCTINTSDRDQFVEMLARSRNALLYVTIKLCPSPEPRDIRNRTVELPEGTDILREDVDFYRYPQKPISRLYTALIPHMARVHTLDIEDEELTRSLDELLSTPAPRLVHFSLNIRTYTLNVDLQLVLANNQLFAHTAPRLRSLSMVGPQLDIATLGPAIVCNLQLLDFSGGCDGLTDDMLNMLRDVPEVVLRLEAYVWMTCPSVPLPFLGPSQALLGVGLDDRALAILPAAETTRVLELVVMHGLVRATLAVAGHGSSYIRDIRGICGDGVIAFALATLPALTLLTVSVGVWSDGLDEVLVIPNLIELTIQVPYGGRDDHHDNGLGESQIMKLLEAKSVPQLPSLKRLVLDGRRYISSVYRRLTDESDLDSSANTTASIGISSQTLFPFVSRLRCAQRPVVTLKGFQLTSMGPNDPSYLGLLDAVDDVECIV